VTEDEWQRSVDPFPMLRLLPTGTCRRKRLLLVCAAWRLVRDSLPEERSRIGLDALEDLAEKGGIEKQNDVEWTAMQIEEPLWPRVWDESGGFQPEWGAGTAALAATMLVGAAALDPGNAYLAAEAEAERAQDKVLREGAAPAGAWAHQMALLSACVRDIFGNPFRPSPGLPPAILGWSDGTVRWIAAGIYEERAFQRLPILADALLDAGCDDEELLAHCRSEGPHARGCWAIDAILGKS
jgi:hypothetical protein